jgi:hypothetical protein
MDSVSTKVPGKLSQFLRLHRLSPMARRIVVGIVGGAILVVGIPLIVLPGPGLILTAIGLVLLASEFAWAQRYLEKFRRVFKRKQRPVTIPAPPP